MFGYFQHEVCKGLERQDFLRFSREFRQVIFDNIPTIKELIFIDPPELQPAIDSEEAMEIRDFRQGIEKVVEQGSPVVMTNTLLLPFKISDGTVVAEISGLDDYLLRKVGNDWLDGLGLLLSREFLLVKRSCVDSLTGLLSSLHLEEQLDSFGDDRSGDIVLVSLYPKGNSSFQAKKYQHLSISLLNNFIENRFPMYYLGQSCFGILCENCDSGFAADFAPTLVNYLKRERCVRVHVAIVPFVGNSEKKQTVPTLSETLMKKAWSALHVASKRGPFAFCNYSSIEDAANHPLVSPEISTIRWLQKATGKQDCFGLLQFDSSKNTLLSSVKAVIGEDAVLRTDDRSSYLILAGKNSTECLEISKKIFTHLKRKDPESVTINCGISSFPFSIAKFRKSELLLNCRKALCHAAFLEPGSQVICDAVSFNISGDIYYGDGDLVRAVKEYKRGLFLDPNSGNLLNSLGVCYAQMNRHKLAVDCFQNASQSKEDKFMALYNLGLEHQIKNENTQAISFFTKALKLKKKTGEEKARQDMSFQLAVLCIHKGQYKRAIELLLPWYSVQQQIGSGEKGLRHLGEAYYGVGKPRDAMKYLQQALRYDEYNAEVFSLLGEIYLRENEGDDIGLRFCEKAVELNPDSPGLKLRLATAQIQCGDFQSALKSLQSCLRNQKVRPAALVQRGLLARELGRVKDAKKWLLKVDTCQNVDHEVKTDARKYLNEWKTI
jgi:tetratricopeptide (TPR) repeat protein